MAVNAVEYREVRREIGARGLLRLEDLQRWLSPDAVLPARSMTFRYAPSIVTRCEAELFNASIPRFAIRAYLDHDRRTFVNLRRIATFSDQARSWGRRIAAPGDQDPQFQENHAFREQQKSPAWVVRRNQSTADSVLTVPKWLSDYDIIKEELGILYGELDRVIGSSYLRHIELSGGGLCSQAVCFMATVLLCRHVRGVHGVADITALVHARGPQDGIPPELPLRGLTLAEMPRYFSHPRVNLACVWQRPLAITPNKHYPLMSTMEGYSRIIESYLHSRCPVLIPTDLNREMGVTFEVPYAYTSPDESIYRTNFFSGGRRCTRLYPLLKQAGQRRPRNHAIMLIGCRRKEGSLADFVFHDPALMPFMRASVQQLWDAYSYADKNMEQLCLQWFLPVTPGAVRMPLSNWHTAAEVSLKIPGAYEKPHKGLFALARDVQVKWMRTCGSCPGFNVPYDPGRFRLCMLNELADLDCFAVSEGRCTDANDLGRRIRDALGDRDLTSWVWIQYACEQSPGQNNGQSVWVWDAEKDPQQAEEYADDEHFVSKIERAFVLAVFERRDSHWHERKGPWCRAATPQTVQPVESEPAGCGAVLSQKSPSVGETARKLPVAILSSFAAGGWEAALAASPPGNGITISTLRCRRTRITSGPHGL